MLLLFATLSATAQASDIPAEGASMGFGVEASNSDGQDLLFDLSAAGLEQKGPVADTLWFGFHVSWDFQGGDGAEIIDRMALSFLEVRRPFEQDRVELYLVFLEAVHDFDASLLDATAFGGGVSIAVWEPYLTATLGLDIRYRAQMNYWSLRAHSALVGIPLEVHGSWQGEIPLFVEGALSVRPSIVAWGAGDFLLDVNSYITAGYVVVDGEQIDILAALTGDFRYQSNTWTGACRSDPDCPVSELTGTGGVLLRF